METNENDYKELAREARKELNNEFDRLEERVERLREYEALLDGLEALLAANRKLEEESDALRQQLEAKEQQFAEEKERRQEVEMKLAEMTKLSAGIAKKASEEAVRNALRTYANTSKRKTVDKRTFAKTAILEIANSNGLTLPQDLAATIESLDDEQAEPKVVNVQGNYNDVHDNGGVTVKG